MKNKTIKLFSIFFFIILFSVSSYALAVNKDVNCSAGGGANCSIVVSPSSGGTSFLGKIGDFFKSIFGIKENTTPPVPLSGEVTPPSSGHLPFAGEEITPVKTQIAIAGLTGNTGPQGLRGFTGPQGSKGDKGESGVNTDTSSLVTKLFFDRQVDGIYNSMSKNILGLSDSLSKEINTKLLTVTGDATIGGNLLATGTILGSNLSGTNTGDNAVNSLYSGLATSKQDALNGTGFVKISGTTISYDNSTYLTSLSGAVLTSQTTPQTIGLTDGRLLKLWATDLDVTNIITGSISGNAGTVTNGAYTNTANTFTNPAPMTTLAESWIGPSSTTGVYFKGGNVGIGTTSPTYLLDIARANGTGYSSIAQLRVNAVTSRNRAQILFTDEINSDGKITYLPSPVSTSRYFSISASVNESDFVIRGDGNVGIGILTPVAKLDVNGGINVTNGITADARSIPGSSSTTGSIVFAGDSRTVAWNGTGLYNWTAGITVPGATVTNVAVGGAGTASALNVGWASVDPLFHPRASNNIVILWIGYNDVNILTAQQIENKIMQYCRERKALGWKVLVATEISAGGFDTLKNSLNTLIRLNWWQYADGIVDLNDNSHLGPDGAYSNLTYFAPDGVHLTNAGYDIVTTTMQTALNDFIIPSTHIPFNKLDVNGAMALGTYAGVNTAPSGTSLIISGNVGIGTTNPANVLDIGTGGGIHITSGTPSSTAMALYNNAGTLTWNGVALATGGSSISGTTNYIPVFTGAATLGNSVLYQLSDNVGIGQTSPTARLSVLGADSLSTSFAANISGATGTGLVVLNNGNVGIGTTNPGYALDILKANGTTYSSSAQLRVNAVASRNRAQILFTDTLNSDGKISYLPSGVSTSRYFSISASVNESDFVIRGDGNVGIGTTAPTNILSLGNGAARKFWIENTATDVVGRALTVAAGSTVAGTSVSDVVGGNLILQSGLGTGTGDSSISFQTGTTLTTSTTLQTMSTKMTILGNGNVGIGATSPTNILHVTGTPAAGTHVARIANTLNGTTQNNGLLILAGNDSGVAVSELITFKRPDNTTIGTITQTGAGAIAFNSGSDKRIKDEESIKPTIYGLSDLLNIKVDDFTFISDPNKQKMTGFIAQELNTIYPNAVTTNGDNGTDALAQGKTPWMIDYSKLTPLLVKSVQELNLKVEDLSSLDTNKATSLGSLIKSFLEDQVVLIRELTVSKLNIDGEVCVDDTCITKEQFKQMLINSGGVSNIPVVDNEVDNSPVEKTPGELLQDANAKITALVEGDYTAESFASFATAKDAALLLPETDDTEKLAKTNAIDDALALLVLKLVPPTCVAPQILTEGVCADPVVETPPVEAPVVTP